MRAVARRRRRLGQWRKDDVIQMQGRFSRLPNATFRVKLENGRRRAGPHLGKMRMHLHPHLPGDRSRVEPEPGYDLTRQDRFPRQVRPGRNR